MVYLAVKFFGCTLFQFPLHPNENNENNENKMRTKRTNDNH